MGHTDITFQVCGFLGFFLLKPSPLYTAKSPEKFLQMVEIPFPHTPDKPKKTKHVSLDKTLMDFNRYHGLNHASSLVLRYLDSSERMMGHDHKADHGPFFDADPREAPTTRSPSPTYSS